MRLGFFADYVFSGGAQSCAVFSSPRCSACGSRTNDGSGLVRSYAQHNYNWRDVVSWVKGNHSFHIGGWIFPDDDTADFRNAQGRPQFSFNSCSI